MNETTRPQNKHVCPRWLLWTFDNPLRRLLHDPAAIFHGLVEPGQTALDIGCGGGFFSLALAELVGERGRVIAADLQPGMLDIVRQRARRHGLNIQLQQCTPEHIGLAQPVDFALAFWMAHEVAYPERFFEEVFGLLEAGGALLLVEPKVHVSQAAFEATLTTAEGAGFGLDSRRKVNFSRAAVLLKPT